MSLVCSVIFIHHAFNANILDKDYAFSDGEILMVDNAVRTHFEPYERHFKEIGFNENTIKKYLQCTNIQTVTVPVPAKFLRASNVPTGLLNEMIAYLNSEERNHHNFSELLLFSCLSIFATCKGFITLLTKEGANKRGNSSRLTQSFHFFMFEPIFSPVNALNQPI